MSDDKFSGTPFTNDYHVRYVDGYRNGYRVGASDRAAGAEAILTDLIAELRTAHHPAADLDGELRLCAEGCGITPCPTIRYTDRAEARLREVTGDE